MLAKLKGGAESLNKLRNLYNYNARDAIISASDLWNIDALEAAELLTGNRWAIVDCKSGIVRYMPPILAS